MIELIRKCSLMREVPSNSWNNPCRSLSRRSDVPAEDQNREPLVSICVPTYNAEDTLRDTLSSILAQTYPNLEIIVVDNASRDGTCVIIGSFKDPRIKAFKNKENFGAERNWNRCLELAGGKYIAIFHADDFYRSSMVEKQVQFLEKNPDVGAVFTEAYKINGSGEVIGEYRLPAGLSNNGIYCFEEVLMELLRGPNFFVCPSAMVRGKIYKDLAPFRTASFGTSADLDMWLRILQSHPVGILDEKLMCYRISDSQGSNMYNKLRTSEADFFKVMDYYLSIFKKERMPKANLNTYMLRKLYDMHACSRNYLIKGQPDEAKALMERIFLSSEAFKDFKSNFVSRPHLLLWMSVTIDYVLTFLGLGERYAKIRQQYKRYKL